MDIPLFFPARSQGSARSLTVRAEWGGLSPATSSPDFFGDTTKFRPPLFGFSAVLVILCVMSAEMGLTVGSTMEDWNDEQGPADRGAVGASGRRQEGGCAGR